MRLFRIASSERFENMEIVKDYELSACQYSVALYGGEMTPKIRTAAKNACRSSEDAAKTFFDIVLAFFCKKNDICGFIQEYSVLCIEEKLCGTETAKRIFSLFQIGSGISKEPVSRKMWILRNVSDTADNCNFLEIQYGLKLLVLNQIIRFGLVEAMTETIYKITAEIEKLKGHITPWIPQTLDAAFRG